MLRLALPIICVLLLAQADNAWAQTRLLAIDLNDVLVCTGPELPKNFRAANCLKSDFNLADPQDNQIWVSTTLTVPKTWLDNPKPLGFYIFAKTSSEVHFNGQLIGRNGTPGATADDETPGQMDVMFPVPASLLKEKNDVILNLSSHHGYLKLSRPLHFVGIGDYGAAQELFSNYTMITIALLGALVLGTFYFGILSLQPNRHSDTVFLSLLGLFASIQLFAEISRSLFSYLYPIHDLRLLVITACSIGFGMCLLAYIANKFAEHAQWVWLIAGGITTALAVTLVEGFDSKTAIAILAPALCSTLLVGAAIFEQLSQKQSYKPWGYLIALILFNATVVLTISVFHNLTFYLIISGMIAYLFAQQARALTKERHQRHEEEKQVAKLSFKLDQIEQASTPSSLTITNSGEVIQLSTNLIGYCKASGDYVEIHLEDNRQQLYSGSLKSLEDRLPSTFLKVHRSYIVNLEFVSKLVSSSKSKSNGSCLVLKDETEIPVSRRVMPSVRQAFSTIDGRTPLASTM